MRKKIEEDIGTKVIDKKFQIIRRTCPMREEGKERMREIRGQCKMLEVG